MPHPLVDQLRLHIGEIPAAGRILGHPGLPVCVGQIETDAPYRPAL